MKQFVCLSGLPRSGSTLLSAILSQNPLIHAEGNSAVCQMMWDFQQSLLLNCREQIQANQRENTIHDILSEIPHIYYKNIDPKEKIIVDKCRSWTIPENIELLKKYIDKGGTPVPVGFKYHSGENKERLSIEEIRVLIKTHVDPEFSISK